MQTQTPQPAQKGELKGWHVLTILIVFFAVIIGVNVYFAYIAIKTNSGEQKHAYLEGLKFNETLEARKLQSELGWKMKLSMRRGAGGDALFIAALTDKGNNPLTGAKVLGKIERTVEAKDDKDLIFLEREKGVYYASIPQLDHGKWEFSATAEIAGKPKFYTETWLSIR